MYNAEKVFTTMTECFAIRFSLHKSGGEYPDDPALFARLFGVTEAEAALCAADYGAYASQCAARLDCGFLKGKRILFLGDSITVDRLGYASIIQTASGVECINGAVSGSTSMGVLCRAAELISGFRPEIVSVMVGTNDVPNIGVCVTSKAEYRRNMQAVLKCAANYGARAVVSTIPPVHEERHRAAFGRGKTVSNKIIAAYNHIVRDESERGGAILNDMDEVYAGYGDIFEPDGVHLNPAGQLILAERLLFTMKEAKAFA